MNPSKELEGIEQTPDQNNSNNADQLAKRNKIKFSQGSNVTPPKKKRKK